MGLGAFIWVAALFAAGPQMAQASPVHPTLAEVNAVVDVLNFRGQMLTDPAKAMAVYAVDYGRTSLQDIDRQMKGAGINTGAGWRFLLGTAVFTADGVTQRKSLVAFYNPWVDSALVTIWQPVGTHRRIVDAAWVPGDLLRRPGTDINPMPLWLRGKAYRPDELTRSVVITTRAIERRFSDPKNMPGWRKTLGIQDARSYNRLIPPLLALTLDETLMRLKALAVPIAGEDPKLAPLRSATLRVIRTAQSRGFGPLLAEATGTTQPMRAALSRINPKTMRGLAPVAFVAGQHQITMFFGSSATADYMISARFVEQGRAYAIAQFEFIPYAVVYQALAARKGAK